MSVPYFDADAVRDVLTFQRTMEVIEEALRTDIDPEADGPRLFSPAPRGEFLLMPSQGLRYSGVKALTVAPDNPARGLEKIQGVYVLYTSDDLAPVAVMDGSSLTAIRTPAVAVSAVRGLAACAAEGQQLPASPRVLVFGAGIQARGVLLAAKTVFPEATFEAVGRSPERMTAFVADLADRGIRVADRTRDPDDAIAAADIIVCATTSSTPLFDGALVKDTAIVAAIGTHGLGARELDDALVERSDLVVEGRHSAQRENGNLVSVFAARHGDASSVSNLRDLARGRVRRRAGHPAVYTGVGMSWQDLVCAALVFEEGAPAAARAVDS